MVDHADRVVHHSLLCLLTALWVMSAREGAQTTFEWAVLLIVGSIIFWLVFWPGWDRH